VNILTLNIESFKGVPYLKRERIHAVLSEILEKVDGDNDGTTINRIEKTLTRFLVRVWNKRATRAINNAVNSIRGNPNKTFTKKDEARVFKEIEKAYNTIEKEIGPRILRDTKKIFNIGQKNFEKKFSSELNKRVQKQGEETAIALGFEIGTEEFVVQMAALQATSIGTHFPRTLQPFIAKTINEAVFEKGLNKAQAGKFLQRELTRKLGGSAFIQSVPPSIRAQGINSINAYHQGLSATNVTLTRNGANIQSMQQGGITQVQFVAVIDNLTSQICSQMDGRVFTLEQSAGFMKGVMEAESVEDLKEFAPWRKDLGEFNLSAGQSLTDPDVQSRLAKAGVIVPPLHFRCRSELHPS